MKKIILILATSASIAFGQGSLTPPTAPAPSMKTLTELNDSLTQVSNSVKQLETRIDVLSLYTGDTSESAYTITQPGSYYLSQNITIPAGKQTCIMIYASGVTLDLNGFSLIGPNSANLTYGAFISSGNDFPVIKNGTIKLFKYGILCEGKCASFDSLKVSSCTSTGMILKASAQIKNCSFIENTGSGLLTQNACIISDCISGANQGFGIESGDSCIFTHCSTYQNALGGIKTGKGNSLVACTARSEENTGIEVSDQSVIINGAVYLSDAGEGIKLGSGCIADQCTSSQNSENGFKVGQKCILSFCLAQYNQGLGIEADVCANIVNCTALENEGAYAIRTGWGSSIRDCTGSLTSGGGIQSGNGSLLLRCIAKENTGVGITAGSDNIVKDCTSFNNNSTGIRIAYRTLVTNNQSHENGGSGLYVTGSGNRIEKNHLNKNNNGISVPSGNDGNFIVNNSCSQNANQNYLIYGTQTRGPYYKPGDLIIAPLNPWTNFKLD